MYFYIMFNSHYSSLQYHVPSEIILICQIDAQLLSMIKATLLNIYEDSSMHTKFNEMHFNVLLFILHHLFIYSIISN